MLTLKDVRHISLDQRGVKQDGITFHSVTTNSEAILPKSLFIPLSLDEEKNMNDLKEALNNGAIGTVWKKGEGIPSFLPTDFPIFFVENLSDALTRVVKYYIETYSMKGNKTVHTKFLLSITCKHSEKNDNYLKGLEDTLHHLSTIMKKEIPSTVVEREGGEAS